jgi:hypothetical protein
VPEPPGYEVRVTPRVEPVTPACPVGILDTDAGGGVEELLVGVGVAFGVDLQPAQYVSGGELGTAPAAADLLYVLRAIAPARGPPCACRPLCEPGPKYPLM